MGEIRTHPSFHVCPSILQECSQHFTHYKSMEIFSDAQGQLTPQSLVRSGRISNSFEML